MKQKELPGYCCPDCESKELLPLGDESIIDKKYRWQCSSCQLEMGTNRSAKLIISYLFVCATAILTCTALLLGFLMEGQLLMKIEKDPRAIVTLLMLSAGIVLGLLIGNVLIKDILSKRPRKLLTDFNTFKETGADATPRNG